MARNTPRDKYFVNEDTVATLCREEGIKYINLHENVDSKSLHFPLFDLNDGHLSVEGNSFIADIVASKLIYK